MYQELLWMPKSERTTGIVDYPFRGRPTRVWTLQHETTETVRPTLPFVPVHLKTAFLEDFVHDWVLRSGQFHYYSRVVDIRTTGIWLLLEWKETP